MSLLGIEAARVFGTMLDPLQIVGCVAVGLIARKWLQVALFALVLAVVLEIVVVALNHRSGYAGGLFVHRTIGTVIVASLVFWIAHLFRYEAPPAYRENRE